MSEKKVYEDEKKEEIGCESESEREKVGYVRVREKEKWKERVNERDVKSKTVSAREKERLKPEVGVASWSNLRQGRSFKGQKFKFEIKRETSWKPF